MSASSDVEILGLKRMLMSVRSKVVEGYTLADGMSEFPHVFDDLYRSMVAAGEKSGHLDQVLNRLADYTEQRQHMRSQTHGETHSYHQQGYSLQQLLNEPTLTYVLNVVFHTAQPPPSKFVSFCAIKA